MGYSHYWEAKREPTQVEWTNLCRAVQKAIELSGVPIAGWNGEGKPEIRDDLSKAVSLDPDKQPVIRFNGKADDDCETFSLRPVIEWTFCKTGVRPYDVVVVASLVLASRLWEGFSWRSDGDTVDHLAGIELADKALGEQS